MNARPHFRLSMRLLALLLVASCWSGCQQGGDVSETEEGQLVVGRTEEREVVERGIEPAGRTLVLRGFNGTIALQGTPETVASLTFEKTARADDAEDARDLLQQVHIEESGGDAEYRYVMQSGEPGRTAVNVRGTVPAGTRLRVEMQNGTIQLSGLTGPLNVDTDNGTVEIGGAGSDVAVDVENGNVDVGMAALSAEARVGLRTSNGNVTLTLPGDASARVEATTQAGTIRTEGGLAFSARDLEPRGAGAQFTGRLGRGTAAVELATRNGTVTLREGRVTGLPALEDAFREQPAIPTAPPDTTPGTSQPLPADTAGAI